MNKLFKGYYKLSDREIQTIWDTGFISMDANILLNIYRYSVTTRQEILDVLGKYSGKLWLPYQVAYEFHKNRLNVIADQIKKYETTISEFVALRNEIIKSPRSPHLSLTIQKAFEKTFDEVIKDLKKKIKYYDNLLGEDRFLTLISKLFKDKVGNELSDVQKGEIEKEGEERYKLQIPPGYKDASKGENKYGDLILWKELLAKSKIDSKPFLLITDDSKEDWWQVIRGKTLSPRPELSQELYKYSGCSFQMYTPDRFLEFAGKTNKVEQSAIDEIREIQISSDIPYFPNPWDKLLLPDNPFTGLSMNNDFLMQAQALSSLGQKPINFPTSNKLKEMADQLSGINSSDKYLEFTRALEFLSKYRQVPKMLTDSDAIEDSPKESN